MISRMIEGCSALLCTELVGRTECPRGVMILHREIVPDCLFRTIQFRAYLPSSSKSSQTPFHVPDVHYKLIASFSIHARFLRTPKARPPLKIIRQHDGSTQIPLVHIPPSKRRLPNRPQRLHIMRICAPRPTNRLLLHILPVLSPCRWCLYVFAYSRTELRDVNCQCEEPPLSY